MILASMPGISSGVIRQRRFTRARLAGRAAPTSFRRGNCQRALCFAGAWPNHGQFVPLVRRTFGG